MNLCSILSVFILFLISQVSLADLPSCASSWGEQNLYNYHFADDTQTAEQAGLPADLDGNFGYANYLDRASELTPVSRQACKKKWTVLVFMAANNDLSPYAIWDLAEMEATFNREDRAASSSKIDVLVDVQTYLNTDLRRYHMFQSTTEFNKEHGLDYYQQQTLDRIESPVAYYQPTRLESTADQLKDFLLWGIQQYPSEHYMVIVWGHGQGFTSLEDSGLESSVFAGRFGGLAFQESSVDYLTTPALSRLLREVKDEALGPDRKIDVYASDACLMQMLEVAYEVSDSTKYIVGSAQTQTYLGLPYRHLFYEMNTGNRSRVRRFDERCGDDYICRLVHAMPDIVRISNDEKLGIQGYQDPMAHKKFTMSSIDSNALEDGFAKVLNRFSERMITYVHQVPGSKDLIRSVLNRSLRFVGEGAEATTAMLLLNQGLSDQLSFLEVNTDPYRAARRLQLSTQSMMVLIDNLSIASQNGEVYDLYFRLAQFRHTDRLSSVSLWLPKTLHDYNDRLADFQNSSLYRDMRELSGTPQTLWEEWLLEVLTD